MKKVLKIMLERAGYKAEMEKAGTIPAGVTWRHRPDFIRVDGKLLYCNFRCLSSYLGGGHCQCTNHLPEQWVEVVN